MLTVSHEVHSATAVSHGTKSSVYSTSNTFQLDSKQCMISKS